MGDVYGNADYSRPDQRDPQRQALIHSIVQAHHWVELFASSEVEDIDELAKREGMHPKILRNRLRLAFLAPGVVSELISSSNFNIELECSNGCIPLEWKSQRHFLNRRL